MQQNAMGFMSRRAPRARSQALLGVVLLAVLVGLTGCRTGPSSTVGTSVGSGANIQGRLPAGRMEQAFTFEGVESSVLDFTLQADRGNISAPDVTLLDPEGKKLPVSIGQSTAAGAATMRVTGVVLTKTGTYMVRVTPTVQTEDVYYRFQHLLRFPEATPRAVHLSASDPVPVYVPAPRNALVVVRVTPRSRGVVPQLEGVEDPWGGRALDPAEVPQGALPPRVSHSADGTLTLTFTTARPGTYAILAGARSEQEEGPAFVRVEVRASRSPAHIVRHPDVEPGEYGLPGGGTPDGVSGAALPPPPLPEDPSLARR